MSALAARTRRGQPRPGLPRFRLRPAHRRCGRRSRCATATTSTRRWPASAPLREAIAAKIEALLRPRATTPTREITVTAGATQALLTAILACVHPGDEVIVLEPCYDSYVPNIELAGGTPVRVPLEAPGPSRCRLRQASPPRSRRRRALIMINTPHNPTRHGLARATTCAARGRSLRGTDVLIISDEVYEHMVYDGAPHESVSRYPELAQRSFVVSSFGKTYHVTGWKVGYVAAPAALTAEFRKVHQFNVFTVNTPMQLGLAHYMADPAPYLELARVLPAQARPVPRRPGADTRFKLLPCDGTLLPVRRLFGHQRPARSRVLRSG